MLFKLFELRVVVWECKDVPAADIEDASDLYVTGTLGINYYNDEINFFFLIFF